MFTSNWVEKNANDYDDLIAAINQGDENFVESILNKCSISGWQANPLYAAVSCKNEKIKRMMCDHYRKFDRYSLIVLRKIIEDWNEFSASDKKIYEKIICELTSGIDDSTRKRNAALAQACESGNVEIVKVLIKQGTNLNSLDKNLKFALPLHLAIMRNQSAVVNELVSAGANVNMSDKEGNRSLHLASEIGNVEIVRTLLNNGSSLDCKNYNAKYSPLHTAVEKGHVDVVEELIGAGALVNSSAKDGKSPLHVASELGLLKIVDILLVNGADADSKISCGTECTSLFLAVEKGHLDVVESLLRANVNVNALATDGKTPLYVGLEFDRGDIVNVLLNRGAEFNVQQNSEKSTLIHIAASYDDTLVIEKLVNMGVDVCARDNSGKTPLHVAAAKSTRDTVELLLSLDADKSLEDCNGRLPFYEAIGSNNFEAVDILFDANEAKKSQVFYEFISDLLKNCQCPFDCLVVSNDAIDCVLMHLIKLEAINIHVYDNNDKLKLHTINDMNYYEECLAEVHQLKNVFLIDDCVSLYDFLHMKPRRRLAYVERVPADLTRYPIYACVIEDHVNEAIERKSLFESTRKALYELAVVPLPDICVERISDFLSVESLRNLSRV